MVGDGRVHSMLRVRYRDTETGRSYSLVYAFSVDKLDKNVLTRYGLDGPGKLEVDDEKTFLKGYCSGWRHEYLLDMTRDEKKAVGEWLAAMIKDKRRIGTYNVMSRNCAMFISESLSISGFSERVGLFGESPDSEEEPGWMMEEASPLALSAIMSERVLRTAEGVEDEADLSGILSARKFSFGGSGDALELITEDGVETMALDDSSSELKAPYSLYPGPSLGMLK